MTTNHRDRLDPALLRPGRADVHVKLDNASEKQIRGLFQRFFPQAPPEAVDAFARQIPVGKISMAKLQGHLLQHREDYARCVERCPDLLRDETSSTRGMTVDEWLHRLNLLELRGKFAAQRLHRVDQLKLLAEQGNIEEHQLNNANQLHARRLWNMLTGD